METKGLDQQENKFLSDFQLERYSRQVILSEISELGQTKLLSSKVAIIGCGGLGCPLGLYLASAGIGSITLVDDDKVELSNLNRQIAFKFSDVEKYKSLALGKVLKNINQEIEIKTETKRLSGNNISQIFFDKDIIIDCTDNYETRLLIARNCFEAGIRYAYKSGFDVIISDLFSGRDEYCFMPVGPQNSKLFSLQRELDKVLQNNQ